MCRCVRVSGLFRARRQRLCSLRCRTQSLCSSKLLTAPLARSRACIVLSDVLVTLPIDITKVRLQLQGAAVSAGAGSGKPRYSGMLNAGLSIVREEVFAAMTRVDVGVVAARD